MNVLYIGGQKSGKTRYAIEKALSLAKATPYYIATYDNSYSDTEMQNRVEKHVIERGNHFITIEQAFDLSSVMEPQETYLVDCLSMWLLNNLALTEAEVIAQLNELFELQCNIVFVLNDVGCGVIPLDSESRRFVDFTGIIGQFVASQCDEVYRISVGLSQQLK